MQLEKKKHLAARTLKVGKDRIVLNKYRLKDIKEAITKQDVRDLHAEKAIMVKDVKGVLTKPRRKTRRRAGSIKKKVNQRKREYMTITRKLRAYVMTVRDKEIITTAEYWQLRKEIRARSFKSLANLKDRMKQMIRGRED